MMRFFEACHAHETLMIPVLDKIVDKVLTLKNLKLNPGLCTALATFLELNVHGLRKLQV